jgi:hypothetical protein
MARFALCLTLFAVLGHVSPANAQQQQLAPPGTSGIDEYVETIPLGDGNARVRPDQRSSRRLAPEVRRRLERVGEDGQRAAALAGAAAPRAVTGGRVADRDGNGNGDGDGDGDGDREGAGDGRGDGGVGGGGGGGGASQDGAAIDLAADSSPGAVAALRRAITGDQGMGILLPLLLVLALLAAAGAAVLRARSRGEA